MSPRRRLAGAALAALSLLVVAGCQKPAPIVTLVNAGHSVYTEATVYCFKGQSNAQGDCATRKTGTTTLAVKGGEPIGVDVAKELVKRSWVIEVTDPGGKSEPQQSEVQKDKHYLSFTAPSLSDGKALLLTVRSLGDGDQPTGEWRFTLVPR